MRLIPECITDFPALAALREAWQGLSARIPESTDFLRHLGLHLDLPERPLPR